MLQLTNNGYVKVIHIAGVLIRSCQSTNNDIGLVKGLFWHDATFYYDGFEIKDDVAWVKINPSLYICVDDTVIQYAVQYYPTEAEKKYFGEIK
jgi:hypothetical protein